MGGLLSGGFLFVLVMVSTALGVLALVKLWLGNGDDG
jgi:hypothetical protein